MTKIIRDFDYDNIGVTPIFEEDIVQEDCTTDIKLDFESPFKYISKSDIDLKYKKDKEQLVKGIIEISEHKIIVVKKDTIKYPYKDGYNLLIQQIRDNNEAIYWGIYARTKMINRLYEQITKYENKLTAINNSVKRLKYCKSKENKKLKDKLLKQSVEIISNITATKRNITLLKAKNYKAKKYLKPFLLRFE